jgi:hypothetical protein
MINLLGSASSDLNFRQRWASYLTIVVAFVGLAGGLILRNSVQNSTQRYDKPEVGITVRYPTNWLVDEPQAGSTADYIVRIQDPIAVPFKTTLQISLLSVGPDAHLSDIPDLLNLTRAVSFATYRPLPVTPVVLPNGKQAIQMNYAYVSTETNPTLQSVPIVVQAEDVIVLRGTQAFVITYRADAQSFDHNLHYFDDFLRSLEGVFNAT